MTPFGVAGLLTGIASVSFGLFVLSMSANRRLGRIWLLLSLAVGVWGFGGMWISGTKTATEGLLAWRLAYAFGVVWIAPLFYHFVCTFLDLRRNRSIVLLRIPMMSISHSDLMPISSERSDARLSQCETVIDISQEFSLFSWL